MFTVVSCFSDCRADEAARRSRRPSRCGSPSSWAAERRPSRLLTAGWGGCQGFRGQQNWENDQQNLANFWRARSRLYQNEILQEKMRSTTFFKLYKICILLHRSNLKIFAKSRFEKTAIFVKFQQKNANVAKFANFVKFQKFQLENLVDFEKC